MSHRRPTLDELRRNVQKARHEEIGNWLARRVARPSAIYGTWVAVRLELSAHQVTLAALASSLAGTAGIGTGTRSGFVLGVAGLHLGFWLDHVDGQVARWRRTSSLDGVYLDYMMHHVVNLALGFALGYGLARQFGNPAWSLAGFAIATGWTLLSLHNDCRYKAFFQRLKSTAGSYRVDGGSGGRPAPPAAWPRLGVAKLRWLAFKSCEPHAVLSQLSILAMIACAAPSSWVAARQALVLILAILAPVLGAARMAKAVSHGASEIEFARWFQPEEPGRQATS
jgi:hypothetical protein